MTQRELTVEDYIAIARRRWIPIACLAVVGCGMALGVAHFLPKRYTSQTLVLVEQPAISLVEGSGPGISTDTSERFATMQQQILSRSRLEPIIRQFKLYSDDMDRLPMEELVGRLRKAIEVTPIAPMAQTRAQGLPGFTIGVTLDKSAVAQQICSTVTSMFMEENLSLRLQKSQQTVEFARGQVAEAKGNLDEMDAKLAMFQKAHLGELPDDREMNLNVLTGLTTQLDAATQALGRAQQDKTYAESALTEQLAAAQASLNGHDPETSLQQIAAMEAQLVALKSRYTDDHPDVAKLKRDIAAAKKLAEANDAKTVPATGAVKIQVESAQVKLLRDQIRQFNQVIQDRTAQQEDLHRRIKTYQERVESSPTVEQEAKAVTRDYQSAQESYNSLKKQLEDSERALDLEQRQQGEQFRVLDPASLPNKPSFPDPIKFAMGGLAGGIGLGAGLMLLLEMKDTSVRSDRDIEALLHLPVLATVPMLTPPDGKTKSGVQVLGRA